MEATEWIWDCKQGTSPACPILEELQTLARPHIYPQKLLLCAPEFRVILQPWLVCLRLGVRQQQRYCELLAASVLREKQ